MEMCVIRKCERNATKLRLRLRLRQATTARPEVMIEFLKKRDIRVVETGLQHGTITVRQI